MRSTFQEVCADMPYTGNDPVWGDPMIPEGSHPFWDKHGWTSDEWNTEIEASHKKRMNTNNIRYVQENRDKNIALDKKLRALGAPGLRI